MVSTRAKRHLNIALHLNPLLVTAFEVPIGTKHFRVIPEYVFPQEHCNPVDVHGSLSRNEQTFDCVALRWHHFRVAQGTCWTQADTFMYDGLLNTKSE